MRLASALWADYGPFLALDAVTTAQCIRNASDLTKDDILLLHGGEDISPSLYNHAKHRRTTAGERPSHRDAVEWAMIERARELDIPIIGICRGAQMLCAAAGGYLIQHVDNHGGGGHMVVTIDGDEVVTNSCHHQMQYPFDVEHELLMWIDKPLSERHLVGPDGSVTVDVEPETVYYPQLRGFAPQWHPEWMRDDAPANERLIKYINERI